MSESETSTITTTVMDLYKQAIAKLPSSMQPYALQFAELFAPMALTDVLDRLAAIIAGNADAISMSYLELYAGLSDEELAAKAAEGTEEHKELNEANAGRISTWKEFIQSCAKSLLTAMVGAVA